MPLDPLGNAIQRVSYTHDAMIDLIIAKPMISQNEIAAHFGYKAAWISRVIRSDAFRERLAARKGEIVDPMLLQSVDDRFNALIDRSLEVLMDKLDQPVVPADVALKCAELGAKSLGFGGYGQKAMGATINAQFVVAMPEKAVSAQDWIRAHSPLPSATALGPSESPPTGE